MSGRIPEEIINDLLHRVDIVEVVREYVPLKKQGQNYTGLCPFHAEKTPSFVVSPQKQIYHCFGCGQGGHVISFLMSKNNLSFPEAVEMLAKRAGISLPKAQLSPAQAQAQARKERFYKINHLTAQFYQAQLKSPEGREAQEYLKKRGLNQEVIENFRLGYAPANWDSLTRFLREKGLGPEELELLGLVTKTQKGSLIDRFRHRLIFPIADEQGRIIGFGGRSLDNSLPKYLNSPDTPLFNKGKFLYALDLSKKYIRSLDQVIIMEGYMDVITAHQYGLQNVVAALGTALTPEQGKSLLKYTYQTQICFDSDAAGQNATMRGMEILHHLGSNVTIITIPEGKDPDEFIQKNGAEAFFQLARQALPLLEYKLKSYMEKYDWHTMPGKIKVIQEILPELNKIASPVAKQGFIQTISDRLAFPETAIYAEIKKMRQYEQRGNNQEDGKRILKNDKLNNTAISTAEKTLMRIVLEHPQVLGEVEKSGGGELFGEKLLKEIYQVNLAMRQAGHNIKAGDLVFYLDEPQGQQLLSQILLDQQLLAEDWERALRDCLILLELEVLNKKIHERSQLMSHLDGRGEATKALDLMSEIQKLVLEKQRLATALRKGGNSLEN